MPGYLPPGHFLAASGLPQIQQHTDPNNKPDPQGDDLPDGVAFPLGDNAPGSTFRQQWATGPDGPQPRTGARADMDQGLAEAMAHTDVANGRGARSQGEFGSNSIQHGRYLRAWNNLAGLVHGLTGRSALSREDYGKQTGRPDLHPQYLSAYAQGYASNHTRADDGGQATAAISAPDGVLVKQADAWSQPRQTTDDFNPPYNSPQTTPDPRSQSDGGDFSAGVSAGQSDRQAGEHPLFADNSSGVSPYVKGYAQGYGQAQAPYGQQDVPASMGGDSGQAANAQEAQRSFQVARASRTASLRRVSAAFAPPALMRDPDFSRAYRFASIWEPGMPLVGKGSARFEAGLYAGITDRPAVQGEWVTAHWNLSGRHPEVGRRIALHRSFTRKKGSRDVYLRREAGTMTDLITDGPGTSPDPMGATPLNGPGTPPPMGGLSDPAAAGGAPPYQGTAPLPGGPVVPDDVMGRPQQQPQPSGPFTQTFSGNHPENASLAPAAPNQADQSGYTNTNAYQGDPRGGQRLSAFRSKVQASLSVMGDKGWGWSGDGDGDSYYDDYPSKGYDTEYSPSAQQLEAEQTRKDVQDEDEGRRGRSRDKTIVTNPYTGRGGH